MDIVTTIKDTVSDIAIANLAGYLGEDINGTKLGLNLGISTFLAGVIKFTSTDKTGRNLLGILNDGGHTGDILNNFETFSGNPEKSRLLETIGGNIVNHFLKDKFAGLTDKIAGQAGIKHSSSSALLNLAAPLVLGFLGKIVREENMSAHDLKNHLAGATNDVTGTLPSALVHALNLPRYSRSKSSPLSHHKAVKELNKDEKRKGENWSMILPWVLLFFVGVMIWYFSRSKESAVSATVAETIQPEIFLPLDSTSANLSEPALIPVEKETVKAPQAPEDKKDGSSAEKSNAAEKDKVETGEKDIVREKDKAEEPVSPKGTQPKKDQPEEEDAQDTTPAGLTRVPASVFARNSAEVVSESALNLLLSSLKQSRKKLVLTPLRESGPVAVDRAYAIRDYLLENGVELSQVEITSAGSGRNPSGVAYKINN